MPSLPPSLSKVVLKADISCLDYSSVIIGAVVIFAGLYWVAKGRKSYRGPKMEMGIDAAFNSQMEQAVKPTEAKP